MATVQTVFDIAIHLMDAQNESTGSTETADTKEYQLRTPSLLNSVLDRAYPASDNWPLGAPAANQRQRSRWGEEAQGSGASSAPQGGASGADSAATTDRKRPICPKISAMTDEIDLDERICTGILPYGLAGLLLTEENPVLANFFWQTFLEQLDEAKRGVPSGIDSIEDVYGFLSDTLEFGRFASW